MSALANWNPQPVVPQPVFAPIKKQYQLARLHEQLQMATNGGRTNIFKVTGYGAQRLPEGHPGLMGAGKPAGSMTPMAMDDGDAPGELDLGGYAFPTSARMASFDQSAMTPTGGAQPPRRPSVAGRA